MPVSTTDQQLLETMKQREFSLKKRQRAANAIFQEARRHRTWLVTLTALVVGVIVTVVVFAVGSSSRDWTTLWHQSLGGFVVGTIAGVLVGQGWLHTRLGERVLDKKELQLNQKYSGDLHAGRRWQQFYYQGEDISTYIPQILYLIESEHRFDSVDEALAFARLHTRESASFRARGLELYREVVAQTDLLVISSADGAGRPSSRFMRFVTTDRPGVWYVTSAPDAPKVHEFDHSPIAVITVPTDNGATISSNRVVMRRADRSFPEIADLYRAQVPRYLEGMTQEDQACELVYELTLESAKVDTWTDHELVVFDHEPAE